MSSSRSKLTPHQLQQIQLKITDLFPNSQHGIFRYNLNPSDFCMSHQEFLQQTELISKQKQLKQKENESSLEDPYIFTKTDLIQLMIRSYVKSHLTKNLKELLKYLKLEVVYVDTILNIVQPMRPRVTRVDVYRMIRGKGIEYDKEKGLSIEQTMELLRSSFK